MNQVILVAGYAGEWGRRVAARLAETGSRVIGLDREAPQTDIAGVDFIQADLRNPLLAELLKTEGVELVCHLALVEGARPGEASFDFNVAGSVKLLGACVEAGVRRVVLKSSTAVYGAHADNSAFLTEDGSLRGPRDLVEVESFCSSLCRQASQLELTRLRFPHIAGPSVDTPMTRFLKEPWAPVLLGFDPMQQIIHENDVVDALLQAVLGDTAGVFNIAAEDALPLSQLMALGGKLPLPIPHSLYYLGAELIGKAGRRLPPHMPLSGAPFLNGLEPDYLRYPCVADLTRMQVLGFHPQHSAKETLRQFAELRRYKRHSPEAAYLAYDEQRLRDTIERRRKSRE